MITEPDEPVGRIVVVDDDAAICEVVSEYLNQNGYAVETASDGRAMDRALEREPADVVVLDIMLPGEDGISICRRLARPGGPAIIILSAMGNETDRIIGIELGADHYLSKPCNPRELLARVRVVLRRRREPETDDRRDPACEFAGWSLNLVRRELRSSDGVVVSLSGGQFSLLRAFVERPQRLLTREQLQYYAGEPRSSTFDRAIDVQISRLRTRFGKEGDLLIRTVRNEGYIFDSKVARTRQVRDDLV